MKKLFNLGSSILIEEYSSLKLNGKYALQKLSPDSIVLLTENYRLEAIGEDLLVQSLEDEIALIKFAVLTDLKISLREEGDSFDDV